jgi:hypothetical protein
VRPRPIWTAAPWLLALALAACGRGEEVETAATYPAAVQWRSHSGVATYQVQAWASSRLLFEETTKDTALTLTPALLRAMAPFDSCRIDVRARDAPATTAALETFWVKPRREGEAKPG